MRPGLFLALAVLAVSAPLAAQTAPDAAFGTWRTQSGAAHVRIAPCGESACGTVVWLRDQAPGQTLLDVRNRDPALRDRPVMGMTLLQGFERSAQGWRGGRIYNAEDGASYRSELLPQPDGTLHVKGCVGPICRTQTWTKAP